MDATVLRCLVAAAAIGAVVPAAADPAASCHLPGEGRDLLTDRAGLLAQYERLPQSCLQAIFAECTAESSRTMLDFGTAAVCSLGYEALLSQGFGGNFRALMAWWREQRDAPLQ